MLRSPLSRLAPLLAAAALFAGPALAQGFLGEGSDGQQPFDVTADAVEHDAQRGVYVARGNVRITQPGREPFVLTRVDVPADSTRMKIIE